MKIFWVVTFIGFFSTIPPSSWCHSYNEYKPEELVALKQIRSILAEDIKRYHGPFSSDGFLIHIIRARNGDVNNSIQMLRDIAQWRQKNNIDNLLNEDFSKFRKQYPYWFDHAAYDGQPIATVPVWDIRKIMLGGYGDYVSRYIDRIFEDGLQHVLNASKVLGKEITQCILIMDLNGYSARTHACVACMPFYTTMLYHMENYYPQSTSVSYLVNTPRIFTHLLELLRPLMSDYTRNTLRIFGVNREEYKRELLKVIPVERLRAQFGGKLHD